jgi:dihydropteroate synthase
MSSSRVANRLTPGLRVRGRHFVWGARTYLMGIVNATPDSFSGDGRPNAPEAVAHACAVAASGADIVDIGAESTRPGHVPIDEGEELRRLIPVVRGLRAAVPDAIVSIDTFKAAVFAAAHAAGGDWLNSIWTPSDELLHRAAAAGVPLVIMHNKRIALYEGDVVDEVLAYLVAQGARAVAAGIAPEAVILDPGIGFGKRPEHNLAILAALARFPKLGFPTLLGTSRKSTIGKLTGRAPGARAFGTAATVALAVAAKIDIVRVHDVSEMRDVITVADAIVRGFRPQGWSDGAP